MPIKISTAFYDAMFGGDHFGGSMNDIEEQALVNVREALKSPENLIAYVPPLPSMLIKLLDALKDPNTDFLDIVTIIEQDPSLALQVVKVANTAGYYIGNEIIYSLRSAVSVIGVSGIAKIASTIRMEKVVPPSPIYHKMFGNQIWLHSLHCASMCKILASVQGENVFDAYFLGLIHDVGKILIFECLCEAFSSIYSESKPGSAAFKELMSEMSIDIHTS